MKAEDIIFLEKSDLNYGGQSVAIVLTRQEFFRLNKWDGRFLYERVSAAKYRKIKWQEVRNEYDRKMTKKYGYNWRNNRWLIEEVRIIN